MAAEIGGGSIRIHTTEIQQKVFSSLGIGAEEAEAKFGFLLEALRYGTPPHGGIALGIGQNYGYSNRFRVHKRRDRFPENSESRLLVTGAPTPVNPEQLKELGLKISQKKIGAKGDQFYGHVGFQKRGALPRI